MTSVAEIDRNATIGVDVADTPEGLSTLHREDCAAVMWRRQPTAQFQKWMDTLAPELLPKARVILRPEDVRSAVTSVCAKSSTPDCVERDLLIGDVAAMADIFAGLMRAQYLRLRLDVLTSNACRKFHIDTLTARLICTYRGTGTQYGISTGGAEPQQIFTVPTGVPIVLRGRLWPDQPRSGLLHRSPPINGAGETRLVLVLDPVVLPDTPPDHLPH